MYTITIVTSWRWSHSHISSQKTFILFRNHFFFCPTSRCVFFLSWYFFAHLSLVVLLSKAKRKTMFWFFTAARGSSRTLEHRITSRAHIVHIIAIFIAFPIFTVKTDLSHCSVSRSHFVFVKFVVPIFQYAHKIFSSSALHQAFLFLACFVDPDQLLRREWLSNFMSGFLTPSGRDYNRIYCFSSFPLEKNKSSPKDRQTEREFATFSTSVASHGYLMVTVWL